MPSRHERSIALAILVTLFAIGLAPARARADDNEELLIEIRVEFGRARFGLDAMSTSTEEDRRKIREGSERCIVAVDAAIQAGMKETDRVDLGWEGRHVEGAIEDPDYHTFAPTLTKIRDFCQARGTEIQLVQLDAMLETFSRWLTILDGADVDGPKLRQAEDHVKNCRAEVKKALDSGVARSAKVTWNDTEIEVADVEKKACQAVADKIKQRWAGLQAAAEAKLKPWLDALKDDKLRLFKEKNLHAAWVRGKGGGFLETPKMMADAKLWFLVYTFDGGDGWTHWRVVRYQFDGHKLKKTSEQTGRGNDPPKAAYK